MYKNQLKIFEFGFSSGNNASYLAKKIGSITSNYKYVATEHPSSFEQAKQTTLEQLQHNTINVNHFEFTPQTFEEFMSLEEKADLIVASHCLAFCQKEKFYEFMQNITNSLKDGGVFMGELYLDTMGPRFMLNQASAIQLLQGKIDKDGKYAFPDDKKASSIFKGFDVKAQVKPNGQLVHFVATKTNCEGTTFEQTDKLVDYTNKTINAISQQYSQISKSAEAKEHRGDWVNYAQIYKGLPPRPLVYSVFESSQGQTWLEDRVYQNNMGFQQNNCHTILTPFGKNLSQIASQQTQLKQENTTPCSEEVLPTSTTDNQQAIDPNLINPESWSVHFNAQTDKLPQGNKFGKEYDNLPPSAKAELDAVMPKSLYPQIEEDLAPVQTLRPTNTDTTNSTSV